LRIQALALALVAPLALNAALTVYPAPANAPLSTSYAVSLVDASGNTASVPVYDAELPASNAAFACFDMAGCVSVTVTCLNGLTLSNFRLMPASAGLAALTSSTTAAFSLDAPRNVVLESNGSSYPLFIFANPLETDIPSPGAPGVIFIPASSAVQDMHAAPIAITASNTTLYIAGGAFVYGQIQVAPGAQNVTICGRGILSAKLQGVNHVGTWLQDSPLWAEGNNSNLILRDLVLLNTPSGAWSTVVWNSSNVLVDNWRVLAQPGASLYGVDGLDLVSVQGGEVRNSLFYTNDDAIAIKAELCQPDTYCLAPPSTNLSIHSNVLFPTWSNGVEIGHELFSGTDAVQGITVQDNDIVNVYGSADKSVMFAALSIHDNGNSTVQGIRYLNNRVEAPQGRLFEFAEIAEAWNCGVWNTGLVQGISVIGLNQVSGVERSPSNILNNEGSQDPNQIQGISLTNMVIAGVPATSADVYLGGNVSAPSMQAVYFSPTVTHQDPCAWPSSTPTPTASPATSGTATASTPPSPFATSPSTSTATASSSATASPTVSSSPTPTACPTSTSTTTASPSPTPSATSTATPSFSATPSATQGAGSFTATPSFTATESLVETPAISPRGRLAILHCIAWPCPWNPAKGPGWVSVELKGSASDLVLKVYTEALVCVGIRDAGPKPVGWSALALPEAMAGMPNGAYFFIVSAEHNGQQVPPVYGRLLVLR